MSSGGKYLPSTRRPHAGSYSAYLCGYNSCNDQIWQVVTLPASFSSLTLSYWIYLSTQETSHCYDTFHNFIRTASGRNIAVVRNLCNINASPGWVQTTVDLTSAFSAYKGQRVQVYFQGSTNATL